MARSARRRTRDTRDSALVLTRSETYDRLSVAPHIVEAMVNHVSGASKAGVAGIYNRAQYSAERRVLACRWADYISQLSAN